MRVLVTGHLGFIGTYLLERLADHDVVGIDRKRRRDVTDDAYVHAVVRKFRPEWVFHLAAEHFVPWCRNHPHETQATNVGGTRTLLRALGTQTSVRAVVLASSAAVYGFGAAPFKESAPTQPVDVYGQSKVGAEAELRWFSYIAPRTTTVAARLSNVVGPGDANDHLVPRLASANGTVTLGNLWPRRDYIYAGDVADALVASARARTGHHIYNVGTGRGTSVRDLLAMVQATRAAPLACHAEPGRTLDGHLVLDPTLIATDLGFTPRTTLEEVLRAWPS